MQIDHFPGGTKILFTSWHSPFTTFMSPGQRGGVTHSPLVNLKPAAHFAGIATVLVDPLTQRSGPCGVLPFGQQAEVVKIRPPIVYPAGQLTSSTHPSPLSVEPAGQLGESACAFPGMNRKLLPPTKTTKAKRVRSICMIVSLPCPRIKRMKPIGFVAQRKPVAENWSNCLKRISFSAISISASGHKQMPRRPCQTIKSVTDIPCEA